MKIFDLQLQSNRHICPYTSIVDENFLSTIEIVDGVDLLEDGGDPRSIAVGSSKTTVAQKGDLRLEIRKCDLLTDGRTDLHG